MGTLDVGAQKRDPKFTIGTPIRGTFSKLLNTYIIVLQCLIHHSKGLNEFYKTMYNM